MANNGSTFSTPVFCSHRNEAILCILPQSQLSLQAVQNSSAAFKLSVLSFLPWIAQPAYCCQWFTTDPKQLTYRAQLVLLSLILQPVPVPSFPTAWPGPKAPPCPALPPQGSIYTICGSDRTAALRIRTSNPFREAEEGIKLWTWRTLQSRGPRGGHNYSKTAYNLPCLPKNISCLHSTLHHDHFPKFRKHVTDWQSNYEHVHHDRAFVRTANTSCSWTMASLPPPPCSWLPTELFVPFLYCWFSQKMHYRDQSGINPDMG